MTAAQRRLLNIIRTHGGAEEGGAEYWPAVNDWVNDRGPARSLALCNINRTVAALLKAGRITIDDDGYFHLVDAASNSAGSPQPAPQPAD